MKVMVILNLVFLLAFVLIRIIRPTFTDLDVRGRYVELDRAGVINEAALREFHPDRGFFPDSRNGVPRYIADPALEAATEHASAGALAALVNLFAVVAIHGTRKERDYARNMPDAQKISETPS